jgi:hypothetical protein
VNGEEVMLSGCVFPMCGRCVGGGWWKLEGDAGLGVSYDVTDRGKSLCLASIATSTAARATNTKWTNASSIVMLTVPTTVHGPPHVHCTER